MSWDQLFIFSIPFIALYLFFWVLMDGKAGFKYGLYLLTGMLFLLLLLIGP